MLRKMLSFTISCAILTTATLAVAQTPWSPLKPNMSKYITDGIFDKSPIKLPFTQISVETITPDSAQTSQDFVHVFDAPYEEVITYLNSEDARKYGIEIFDTSVFPEAKGIKVRAIGSKQEDGGLELRFAHRKLSRDVLLLIVPQNGQTHITFKNLVLTNISSGVMPARAGFKGDSLPNEIPFNWN